MKNLKKILVGSLAWLTVGGITLAAGAGSHPSNFDRSCTTKLTYIQNKALRAAKDANNPEVAYCASVVNNSYKVFLARTPDQKGFNYWVQDCKRRGAQNGKGLHTAYAFMKSKEAKRVGTVDKRGRTFYCRTVRHR